ncbi:N-acetylmuramoyl-L-alanine amidase [Lysinibacillus halotolerans]
MGQVVKFQLDPGHGGIDPGAVKFGLQEDDVNLKVAKYAKAELEQYENAEVRLTRTTDTTVDLSKRDDLADNWGADYFASYHVNAGGGEGFETFIYDGPVQKETKALQNAVHDEVLKAIKQFYPGVKDRGKKRANLSVLRETEMPAVLIENLFIDDKEENALLKDEAFLKAIGVASATGLAKQAKLKKKVKRKRHNVRVYWFPSSTNSGLVALKKYLDSKKLDYKVTCTNGKYMLESYWYPQDSKGKYALEQWLQDKGFNYDIQLEK